MKQYKLYNGTIILEFDEAKHMYHIEDTKVDGVTSILGVIAKPALMNWAVGKAVDHVKFAIKPGVSYDEMQLKRVVDDARIAHRSFSRQAADVGSMIHKWIEDWIAGKNPPTPVNQQIRNATDQFLIWVEQKKVKFIVSEQVIYSKKWNYAGTCDFIAELEGKKFLGDFKSSNGIWDEYWFQTAAYQQAFNEEFANIEISGNIIVRLGKDGSIEIKENLDYEKNVQAFNAAAVLYRRLGELRDEKFRAQKIMQKLLI